MSSPYTLTGAALVLLGASAWWFVPTMAAPMVGLVAVGVGLALVVGGLVRARAAKVPGSGAASRRRDAVRTETMKAHGRGRPWW